MADAMTFLVPGSGPGLLALHAWWGMTPFFQKFCARLAAEGFTVLAPDLYAGQTATTIPDAEKLRGKLRREVAGQSILQATEKLRSQPGVGPTLGVVGFSLGAYWALWLAEQPDTPLAATVLFYGNRGGEYHHGCPAFQGHFAEYDPYTATSGVKKLEKTLKAAGKTVEFYTYPGTGHWFFEQDRVDAYQAQAAQLAWERMVTFLHVHLPGESGA